MEVEDAHWDVARGDLDWLREAVRDPVCPVTLARSKPLETGFSSAEIVTHITSSLSDIPKICRS